jgi:predicted transcriptional regulator
MSDGMVTQARYDALMADLQGTATMLKDLRVKHEELEKKSADQYADIYRRYQELGVEYDELREDLNRLAEDYGRLKAAAHNAIGQMQLYGVETADCTDDLPYPDDVARAIWVMEDLLAARVPSVVKQSERLSELHQEQSRMGTFGCDVRDVQRQAQGVAELVREHPVFFKNLGVQMTEIADKLKAAMEKAQVQTKER